MILTWTSAAPAVSAAFLSSLVEAVEALTIVLAVATVRGWKPAGLGALAGLASLGLIVLALGPLLDRFSQPAHAEQQQQNADGELERVQRNAIEKRAEGEDDEPERGQAGERAEPCRPPAADGCDREHDCQRLHGFDERAQERRRNGGGHRCPTGNHEGGREKRTGPLTGGGR